MYYILILAVLMWADLFADYVMWLTMTYFTNVWKISYTHAAAILNVWGGVVHMLPIGLGHLADAFVGNFSVLLVSTVSYSVGLGLLAMSTPPVLAKHYGNCSDYKPECIGKEQKHLFYVALGLIAVGMAGHLTTLGPFSENQMEDVERDEDGNIEMECNPQAVTIFLGMFAMVLIPIAGIIVIPYIKPWSVRYGIAAIFSLVSLLGLLVGICVYEYVGPQGSPLTTIFRVFVAATFKLFSRLPRDVNDLYERPGLGDESLYHTRGYGCLDKAAIVLPNKPREQQEVNRWRLCGITEVEETKIVLRMIPMWLTFILVGVVSSVGNTYFLEQANHLDQKVGRLKVPLPVLLWFYQQGKSYLGCLYFMIENLFGSAEEDDTDDDVGGGVWKRRYAPPVGIAVSMVFAVLCCITAAKVEARRLHIVASHGLAYKPDDRIPMTMFWLLPQFVLLGAMDGMFENSLASFFEDQVGPSMKRYMGFLGSGVLGSGIMGSALSVYVVGTISERGGRPNWFQFTINKSRLDRYYWVLAALCAVNLVVYILIASVYVYRASRPREEPEGEEDGGDDDDCCEINLFCCCR